jgi:hypothetical protein
VPPITRAGPSVTRDPQPFQQWLAQDHGLAVADKPVPVASYYTYFRQDTAAG